ncbi:SKI/DACH domain-containing protein 1 [Syngnathoides biaculeatus]|uniref:SKI/DACH domain-containing protein 1 n=1 Tax=Syngnathoides biaculeatus TaxID=300417 RepID=UPI002ADDB881|nr:SKI/DACH domain-containing protein 1 [Syngnathoides biaculeatus]
MGDLECGFEEMQGVRLGYLLIQGKQMFALSQVFTELLKNIPRTTVHKRMDHLKVKKHHCDLEELRKLKAINSIAFHAAKCTLISREDVEALYFSCKTERVLKSGNNKRKDRSCPAGDGLASAGVLRADAELWQEKVWFSLHGVQDKAARGRKNLCASKLPHFYQTTRGRDYHSATKSTHRHLKNYETVKLQGNRATLSYRHSFFRSAPEAALQAAMAAHSRLSRAAGDLHHKRKRRREGGGGKYGVRHHWRSRHHQHVPPVLLVQPKSPFTHRSALGAFQLSPDFYLHPHHLEASFPESSDTESSTYSDRAYPDSDFGSSSSSDEEEEDEDDTQSESTELSSDVEEEEESSSHSDSSSVSSRISVQSIRFRRARVGTLAKTLNPMKAPLVLQPTFHYNHQQQLQQQQRNSSTQSHVAKSQKEQSEHDECEIRRKSGSQFLSVIFTENKSENEGPNIDPGVERVRFEPQMRKTLYELPRSLHCPINHQCGRDKDVKRTGQRLPTPPKKIKTETEELSVTASPRSENHCNVSVTPHLALHEVKLKLEDCCGEYECQSQADAVQFQKPPINADKYSSNSDVKGEAKSTGNTPDVPPAPPVSSHGYKSTRDRVEERETKSKKSKASEQGRRSRLSRAQAKQARVTRAASSSSSSSSTSSPSSSSSSHPCVEGSAENLPSRRKRSSTTTSTCSAKMPFSLMASFPFLPSLVVGSDGDLCPAYSLNSLRDPGPPPSSHPVWRWQPGGHILPPPHAHTTGKLSSA